MATVIHEYPVNVNWNGGREGAGAEQFPRSGAAFPLSVPPEFGGPGTATNPEELLTGAVAACYSITFGIVAANRKLPVAAINVAAVGEVEQNGAAMTFKKITVRPSIVVEESATEAQKTLILEMAHKADNYCIVSNAVRGKVEIILEPSLAGC